MELGRASFVLDSIGHYDVPVLAWQTLYLRSYFLSKEMEF